MVMFEKIAKQTTEFTEQFNYFKYEIKQRVKEVEKEFGDKNEELNTLVSYNEKDCLNL